LQVLWVGVLIFDFDFSHIIIIIILLQSLNIFLNSRILRYGSKIGFVSIYTPHIPPLYGLKSFTTN
jgi:hypothetical protein